MVASSSMYSNIPLRRINCFFSDKTISTSSSVKRPVVTWALRYTFSASSFVNPKAALRSFSRASVASRRPR